MRSWWRRWFVNYNYTQRVFSKEMTKSLGPTDSPFLSFLNLFLYFSIKICPRGAAGWFPPSSSGFPFVSGYRESKGMCRAPGLSSDREMDLLETIRDSVSGPCPPSFLQFLNENGRIPGMLCEDVVCRVIVLVVFFKHLMMSTPLSLTWWLFSVMLHPDGGVLWCI